VVEIQLPDEISQDVHVLGNEFGTLDRSHQSDAMRRMKTPHRMDITCSLDGRTARAEWRHPPLVPSKLQHLHCPG
jgi:hypothetical protein